MAPAKVGDGGGRRQAAVGGWQQPGRSAAATAALQCIDTLTNEDPDRRSGHLKLEGATGGANAVCGHLLRRMGG